MTLWSKRNWDKGSEEGLKTQRPDYFAAVIQYVCMVCLMIWRLPLTHIFASERGLRLCLLFTNLKKFTPCCPMNPKALSSDMVPNTSGLLAPRCQNPKHKPPLRFLLVYNLSYSIWAGSNRRKQSPRPLVSTLGRCVMAIEDSLWVSMIQVIMLGFVSEEQTFRRPQQSRGATLQDDDEVTIC